MEEWIIWKIWMTTRNLNRILILSIGLFSLAGCTEVNPPSETLDAFIANEENDRQLIELYFYPSTVRMIDKFLSNGEGGLLDGVKEGRLFYSKLDTVDVLQGDLPKLRKGLENEGFGLLAEFRNGSAKTVAFVREASIDRYVVLVGGADVPALIVELKGDISMATLRGLNDLNSNKVMSLLELSSEDNEIQPESADTLVLDSLKME